MCRLSVSSFCSEDTNVHALSLNTIKIKSFFIPLLQKHKAKIFSSDDQLYCSQTQIKSKLWDKVQIKWQFQTKSFRIHVRLFQRSCCWMMPCMQRQTKACSCQRKLLLEDQILLVFHNVQPQLAHGCVSCNIKASQVNLLWIVPPYKSSQHVLCQG